MRGPVTAATERMAFGGDGAKLDSDMLKVVLMVRRGEAQRASAGSSGLLIGLRRNVFGLDA